MGDRERYSSQRRSTDPYRSHRHHDHHHQHTQPKYAPVEYVSRRRHTEPKSSDAGLTRVHSRPEDYMNKPRPDKLLSYICFDSQGHPRECDEMKKSQPKQTHKSPELHSKAPEHRCRGEHVETKAPLHQVDSYSSNDWARTDDSGDDADSEDELTLPSMYHHDIASRDNEWTSSHKQQSRSPERQRTDNPPRTDVHREQERRRSSPIRPQPSAHRRSSASPSPSPSSSRRSSPSHAEGNAPIEGDESLSPNAQALIAKVAAHLQAHKGEYKQGSTKQLVNELLGEVVRKVADGGLDSKLMKEVVREVQHVL